jgi:hypothetical protein
LGRQVSIIDCAGIYDLEYYQPRRETGLGHVGLRQYAGNCYLSSVVQALWSLRCLRKAVYDMPTETVSRRPVRRYRVAFLPGRLSARQRPMPGQGALVGTGDWG